MSINPEGTSPKTEDSSVVLQRKFVDFLLNTIFNDRDAISVFPDGNAVKNGDSVQKLFQKLLGAAQSGIKYVESDTDAYGPNTVNTGDNSVIVGVDSTSDTDNTAKLAAGDSEIAVFEGEGFVQPYVTSVTPIEYDVPSSDGIAIKDNQMGFRLGGDTLYVDINDGKGSVRTLSLGAVPLGEYEQFLNDCGGLVYDLGQEDRPILDRKVLGLIASQEAKTDTLQGDISVSRTVAVFTSASIGLSSGIIHTQATNKWQLRQNFGTKSYWINSTDTGVTALEDGSYREVTIIWVGEAAVEMLLNGVSVWTGSAPNDSIGSQLSDPIQIGNSPSVNSRHNGRIAYISFTDANGDIYAEWGMNGTGLDSSGNGRHLTLINNPSFVVDNTVGVREVLELNGSNQYGSYDTSDTSDGWIGAHTISTKTKLKSYSVFMQVIHARGVAANRLIVVPGTNTLSCNGLTSTYVMPLNTWVDIDVEFDSNGHCIDIRVDSVSYTTGTGSTTDANGNSNYYIGRRHASLNADIDVASNVITLSNGDVYARWNLNGNSLDSSGNGRDLTLVNNPQFIPSYELSTTDELDPINTVGYSYGTGQYAGEVIPPDVANNGLDALGNTLDVSGDAYPHPRQPVNSACRLFTGSEYITSGYIEGTETIASYVGTAVPTVSSGRVDFTSGWCARVTLSSGLVITLNNAGNSEISSDGNVVQYINAPASSTQNDLHAELLEGYTRYIDTSDSNALRHVIYKDGRPLFIPVLPDGWVKAGEYPAIPQGHNEARTQFNFTHITETGNRPPEIEATGLDLQNYSFGDTLTNPFFKRTMASFNEDRHTMFPEALTGDCLTKANQHYSTN